MFCKKCGHEIEDLAMYCGHCGAKQFGLADEEKVATQFLKEGNVIINAISNKTTTMTGIQSVTGMRIIEIQKLLKELPAVLFKNIEEKEALETVKMLQEAGVDAIYEPTDIPWPSQNVSEVDSDSNPDEIQLVLHPTPEADKEFLLEMIEMDDDNSK